MKRMLGKAAIGLVLVLGPGANAALCADVRLIAAAKGHDAAAVRQLVREGLDVNARLPDGSTALLWAAYHGDLDIVTALLSAGADPAAANTFGATPLSVACRYGHAQVVEALLAAGASVTAAEPTGETPLMTAARSGNVAIVSTLLARGAAVDDREAARGQTALMAAVAHGHTGIVEALLRAGADVNVAATSGSTALHFAVQRADVAAARLLLAAGANVHAAMTVRQIDGFTLGLVETLADLTPLMLAIATCRQDGIEYYGSTVARPVSRACPPSEEIGGLLLSHGADPNASDGSRIPPVILAVHAGMPNLVRRLIAHGADPDALVPENARQWTGPNRNGARAIAPIPIGATAFIVAAWWHRPELMRALVAAGADPLLTTPDGTNALMAASGVIGRPPMGYSQRLDLPTARESIALAVQLGLPIAASNDAGQTAMHGAARLRSSELIQALVAHGASADAVDKAGRTPLDVAESAADPERAKTASAAVQLLRKLTSRR